MDDGLNSTATAPSSHLLTEDLMLFHSIIDHPLHDPCLTPSPERQEGTPVSLVWAEYKEMENRDWDHEHMWPIL
jgi:hypothetical protein